MALAQPKEFGLSIQRPSLSTILNTTDSLGGDIKKIAELLDDINPIYTDAPCIEANNGEYHETAYRVSLPKAYVIGYNEGIPSSFGEIGHKTEKMAMFGSRLEMDYKLMRDKEAGKRYRIDQMVQHVKQLSRALSHEIFYGTASDKSFDGLANRYNSLDPKVNSYASQVVNAKSKTSKGNYSSIYAVKWGANSIHGIHPKGVSNIIMHEDFGRAMVPDGRGNTMGALVDEYTLYYGIAIPDPRAVVRICNIDTQELENGVGIGDPQPAKGERNLFGIIRRAMGTLMDPDDQGDAGRLVIYASRQVIACLQELSTNASLRNGVFREIYASERANANVPEWEYAGMKFKVCDAISNDEVEVV